MAPKKEHSENNVKFAKGGNTPMFGKMQAEQQDSGQTEQASDPGPGAKFAKGGSNKMFGFSPSVSAKAGITSAR